MPATKLFDESPSAAPLTVGAVVRLYLVNLELRVADRTFSVDHLATVTHNLGNFRSFVGPDRFVLDCRQYDLTGWLAANPQWKSACTRRNAIGAVLGCFSWAEDEELIDRSPFRRPRALKGQTTKPRRPASYDEYRKLLGAGSIPLKRALFMLWRTGMRTCELRNLLWADVVLDGASPHIRLRVHKTMRSTMGSRYIALDRVVAKFLRWLRARPSLRRRGQPFVFTNCDGNPWDRHTFARHLRRIAKRIGLDDGAGDRVSAYCLRHSYACNALEGGATSKEVADQLGHADTTMVERVYGSHTSKNLDYLSATAERIRKGRKDT